MDRSDRRFFISFFIFAIIVFTLPTVVAYLDAGPDHVFGGVLLNPIDGYSYLAKAYQGWQGNWKFTLPYSAEKSGGIYIQTYYLFLGHLARIFGFSLSVTLNLAKFAGSGSWSTGVIGHHRENVLMYVPTSSGNEKMSSSAITTSGFHRAPNSTMPSQP